MRKIAIWLAAFGLGVITAPAAEVFRGTGVNREALRVEFTLTLDKDGTAELSTKRPRYTSTARCSWERVDGELTLQYRDIENKPRGTAIVWRQSGGVLTPLRWSKDEWGELGPPTLRGGR